MTYSIGFIVVWVFVAVVVAGMSYVVGQEVLSEAWYKDEWRYIPFCKSFLVGIIVFLVSLGLIYCAWVYLKG